MFSRGDTPAKGTEILYEYHEVLTPGDWENAYLWVQAPPVVKRVLKTAAWRHASSFSKHFG